jgi:ribosomal protein L37AE/L43A
MITIWAVSLVIASIVLGFYGDKIISAIIHRQARKVAAQIVEAHPCPEITIEECKVEAETFLIIRCHACKYLHVC